MKKTIVITLAIISLVAGSLPLANVLAAGSSLYLSPSSKTINKGSSFSSQLRANISSESAGGSNGIIYGTLSYNDSRIQVTAISSSGSGFAQLPSQNYNNSNGTINFYQAYSSSETGNRLIMTITFKAVGNGSAPVTFKNAKVSYYGSTSTSNGNYTVVSPSPPPPPPSPPPPPPPSPSSPSSPPSPSPSPSPIPSLTPTPSSPQSPTAPSTPKPKPKPRTNSSNSKPASPEDLHISGVSSTNAYDSAQLKWRSNFAATFEVSYGSSQDNLKSQLKTTKKAESGKSTLKNLKPGVQYYYQIEAASSKKQPTSYQGQLKTQGFPVQFNIINPSGKPAEGAKLTIGEKTYQADKNGHVSAELPAGGFEVSVSTNKDSEQFSFKVKSLPLPKDSSKAPETQYFSFTLTTAPFPWLAVTAVLGLFALLATGIFLLRRRQINGAKQAGLAMTAGIYTAQVPPAPKANIAPQPSNQIVPPVQNINQATPLFTKAEPTPQPTVQTPTPMTAPASPAVPPLAPPAPAPPLATPPVAPQPTHHRYNSVYLDEEEPEDMYELAAKKAKSNRR